MPLATSASDIRLTLTLPQTVFIAGDRFQASLDVDVQRDIRVTAIRFSLTGKEKARYVPQRLTNLMSVAPLSDAFVHYRKRITLFGTTSGSETNQRAVLTRGAHRFAIDLQLPFSCPPSFRCAIRGAASDLTYKVKVALYRASSRTAAKKDTIEQRILLLSSIPMRQLTQAQVCEGHMAREMVQVNSCSESMPERVVVEASVYPSLLLLQPPNVLRSTQLAAGSGTVVASLPTAGVVGLAPAGNNSLNASRAHAESMTPLSQRHDGRLADSSAVTTADAALLPVMGTPLHSRVDEASAPSTSADLSPPQDPPAQEPPSLVPALSSMGGREWCSHVAVVSHGAALTASQRRSVAFFPTHTASLHMQQVNRDHTPPYPLPSGEANVSRLGEAGSAAAVTTATPMTVRSAEPARTASRLASTSNTLARLRDFQILQHARAFKVAVVVTNTSTSVPLFAVRVALLQRRLVKVRGSSQCESVTVASAEVRDPMSALKPRESTSSTTAIGAAVVSTAPLGPARCPYTVTELPGFCVKPGEHVRLDVTLVLTEGSMPLTTPPPRRFNGLREVLRLVPEGEKHALLPSLCTPFLDASCVLEVSFPGISTSKKANGKSYAKTGVVAISSAVDSTNVAWPAPSTYELCYSPPEEDASEALAAATASTDPAEDGDPVNGEHAYSDDEGGRYAYTALPNQNA